MTDAEEVYVAARILEELAKYEDNTGGAAVCARVAERARNARVEEAEGLIDKIAADGTQAEKQSARKLRVALKEVRERGSAHVADNAEDRLVARFRSEY
jgi:hypothetical protein